jgi:hypothetical protein
MIALLAALRVLAPVSPNAIQVDAFFQDWEGLPADHLTERVSGDLLGPDDLGGTVQIAYTDTTLYVGAQIRDDHFTPEKDALHLVFVPAKGAPMRLEVSTHELEGPHPATMRLDGKAVPDGRIASTTRKDGWAIELSVPLRALPGVMAGPLAFAAVVDDVDPGDRACFATAPLDHGLPKAPDLDLDLTAGLFDQYRQDRGLSPQEWARARVDVTGDGTPEQVVVNAADVVVLGRLPGDATYFYFQHGWGDDAVFDHLDFADLDGRPGAEMVVTHHERVGDEVRVEILEVYGVRDGFLKRMFGQKIAEENAATGASLRSTWRYVPRKDGPQRIAVSPAVATKLDAASYQSPEGQGTRSYEPIPLPWNEPKDVVYELQGDVWLRK